jgi:hypothetical protein
LKVVISAIPVSDFRPWNRDSVEEMSAMTRIPCLRQVAVLATLLTLTLVPMAGARNVGEPGAQPAGDSWVGVAVRAIEGFFSPAYSARSHRPMHPPPAGDSWVGVAVRAIEGFFSPAYSARSHRPVQNRKDDSTANQPAGGGCIGPDGRPKPLCL